MLGDPYCGNCHYWMTEMFPNIWVCNCTVSGQAADTSKDPNCHNSHHDHYDPESPIVLARQAEYAAERQGGCTCIGRMVDYTGAPCPVHPIVYEEEFTEEPPKPLALRGVIIDEPKHACGGCNLRDLTMREAKRYLSIALMWMPDNDQRREIAQWLRMTGKVRAMDVHHHGLSGSVED